jgi:4-carboxymuconolactone decarboxylase
MDLSERRQRGAALLQQMLGPEQAAWARQLWQGISPELDDYIVEFVAGEIWSRPQLDLRSRSLVTVGVLAALGRPLALELNIRIALNNGLSRQELIEAFLQLAVYAGFPAAWEALAVAHKVFRELDEAKDDRVV